MLTKIAGEFVRIVYADDVALTLNRDDPARPSYILLVIPNLWISIGDNRS